MSFEMNSTSWGRRQFIRTSGLSAGMLIAGLPFPSGMAQGRPERKKITITRTCSDFEREPLVRPFGFKGGFMSEIWQSACFVESDSGKHAIGLCTQNVLWSDAEVFAGHAESGGNALMYALTERVLQMIKGESFVSPDMLLDDILPEVYELGKRITGHKNLRKTFALNALVGIDNALWLLFAKENGISGFDGLIPERYKSALSYKHEKVAAIPLMAYNIPIHEIESAVREGYFFMKIKIGQPGTQDEMLEKDKARLTAIHKAISHLRTPYSKDGKLPYYFDANGRYETRETLLKLIDHARKIGAFDQIAIIEEPFAEELEMDVSDIPVRLAADESAHTDEDAVKRIQMGYKAVALKAIAKTLSMTMKIAREAFERNIPCFCADLTVNPVLIEWNKNVAARLPEFPGMGSLGLLESNGHQNYKNWNTMLGYHPRRMAPWVEPKKGVYELNEEFYRTGGGIFDLMPHYEEMFDKQK